MRATTAIAASLCALMLGACPEDEAPYLEEDSGDVPHDEIMVCPAGVPETKINMTVEGAQGAIRAKLVEADDLPAVKGFNRWVIEFIDADGEPLDDVELELDRKFGQMPAHNHDTNHDPVVESLGDGRFAVDEINLLMDGRWLLTFAPSSASLGDDSMTFELCTQASITAAEEPHGDAH